MLHDKKPKQKPEPALDANKKYSDLIYAAFSNSDEEIQGDGKDDDVNDGLTMVYKTNIH